MSTEYFRLEDPIENLELRVVIQEVVTDAAANPAVSPYKIDTVVKWQERRYFPSELADYFHHQQSQYGSPLTLDRRGAIGRLERSKVLSLPSPVSPVSSTSVSTSVSPFSTVKDFLFSDPPVPFLLCSLTEREISERERETGDRRHVKRGDRRDRRQPQEREKRFRLYLVSDVDYLALRSPSLSLSSENTSSEHLLVEIGVSESGLVSVSPPLSSLSSSQSRETETLLSLDAEAERGGARHTSLSLSLDLSLTEKQVESAMKSGFTLTPRLLSLTVPATSSGARRTTSVVFSILNLSAVYEPPLLERLEREKRLSESVTVAAWRNTTEEVRRLFRTNTSSGVQATEREKERDSSGKDLSFFLEFVGFEFLPDCTSSEVALHFSVRSKRRHSSWRLLSLSPPSLLSLSPLSSPSDHPDPQTLCSGATHWSLSRGHSRSLSPFSPSSCLALSLLSLGVSLLSVALGLSALVWVIPCLSLLILGSLLRLRPESGLSGSGSDRPDSVWNYLLRLRFWVPDTTEVAAEEVEVVCAVFERGVGDRGLYLGGATFSLSPQSLSSLSVSPSERKTNSNKRDTSSGVLRVPVVHPGGGALRDQLHSFFLGTPAVVQREKRGATERDFGQRTETVGHLLVSLHCLEVDIERHRQQQQTISVSPSANSLSNNTNTNNKSTSTSVSMSLSRPLSSSVSTSSTTSVSLSRPLRRPLDLPSDRDRDRDRERQGVGLETVIEEKREREREINETHREKREEKTERPVTETETETNRERDRERSPRVPNTQTPRRYAQSERET